MDWPGRIYAVEHRIKSLLRQMADVLARLARLETNIQQIPTGGGSGGAGAPHWYLARGDGAAVATGTFPSITPGTFTSDVLDIVTAEVVETGASVEWWYTDALTTDGALVWCVKKPDGTFVGVLEQCTAIALDA